jgi:hypothetical protein
MLAAGANSTNVPLGSDVCCTIGGTWPAHDRATCCNAATTRRRRGAGCLRLNRPADRRSAAQRQAELRCAKKRARAHGQQSSTCASQADCKRARARASTANCVRARARA